ncbi:DUF1996 domain-containing protein [Arsukibacterium sp.]|uniref:DUF1996 domain-containing protein n=1 Tax=Arsukibacterium sp. TaxID=1977258 RepID=UPI0035624987
MERYRSAACVVLLAVLNGCGSDTTNTDSADSNNGSAPAPVILPAMPVLSAQPAAVSQQPFAEFRFASADAQSYACQLNDEPEVVCNSPYLIYPLDVQQHTLQIRAVAADGKVSEPALASWTVSSIFADENLSTVHPDLIATSVQPAPTASNGWRGIFRINCDLSHSGYNDPIVYPGQKDAAHLHRFYGNTLLDENSDLTSLFTTGESSCQGNELNRSAYWVPALLAPSYDVTSGERLLDDNGDPAWQIVPAVVGNDDEAHEIFYYSAGVDELASIQPIPLGLKMIAGSAMGMPGMAQDTSIVRWHCQSWESNDATNPRWSASIPECVAPDRLRMDIFFPSCWNGVDLDSADHKSHLAYPVNSGGANGAVCPGSHPVPIIRVSFHYAYGVKPDVYDPQSRSSRGWRFASDMYEVSTSTPGGMSLHGDWFNAWYPEALQAVLDGCIRQQLDCHDGNLANGYRLSGTRPGSQNEVPIVNKGMGY